MMKDPLSQLREIENSILLMFETRDYIEDKSDFNRDLSQRYQNAERTVDAARKKIRYERKKRMEQEIVQARQDKIQKRVQRANEASLNVN
jgi:hypothetical protein